MSEISAFDNLKESLEKQILTVLDFLLTDNQITDDDVINISKDVLNSLDLSQTRHELHGYLYRLLTKYPPLSPHLENTLKFLNESSHGN